MGTKGIHKDLVTDVVQYKGSLHDFYLDLKAWRRFQPTINLNWTKIRFGEENKNKIPKERGIYVFSVALNPSALPEHGYILYVGIAGDNSSGTLRSRYNKYLSDYRRGRGRPRVYYMISQWEGDLFFSFVPITDQNLSLRTLETEFISAVNPQVNIMDFEAKVSNMRRAAF